MSEQNQSINSAVQSLKKAATKGKTKKSVLENIDNISSSVILLVRHALCPFTNSEVTSSALLLACLKNSSSPSSRAIDKLVNVFRKPLVPLYSAFTDAALEVSAAILDTLLNHLILACIQDEGDEKARKAAQAGWERVADSLLSGVIVSPGSRLALTEADASSEGLPGGKLSR